ncbi:MAG: hypothetical protein SCM96_05075 [Acidobacteriota bacterium]|nr:hypothetical protein [Acidobacteriota bacterium]
MSEKIVLVIIHENMMSCPLCQAHLDEFLDRLYSAGLETSSICVFVPSNPDRSPKILARRIRGFAMGNNIRFPVIIAGDEFISENAFKDTDVIFINLKKKVLLKYRMPLSLDQWKELFSD